MSTQLAALGLSVVILGVQPSNDNMARAEQLIEQGEIDSARRLLRQTIKQSDNIYDAMLLLGRTYLYEKPDAARTAAIQVLAKQPGHEKALQLLTTSYSVARKGNLSATDERELRIFEIQDYQKVLAANPDLSDVLFRSASQRLALERLLPSEDHGGRRQQLILAVSELQRVVKLTGVTDNDTARASAHYQHGRALKHYGDFLKTINKDPKRRKDLYQKAISEFSQAFELDFNRADAVGEIVLVRLADGDRKGAIRAVKSRIDRATKGSVRAKMYSLLGNLYVDTGNLKAAVAALERVLQLNAGFMDSYLGLYRVYKAQKDDQRAEQILTQAVTREPAFLTGHLLLGQMRVNAGDYAGAIKHFEAVMEVAPASAVVLGMLPSPAQYRSGRYYTAAAWLAWLYMNHAGDGNKALAAVNAARRFRPLDPRLIDTQGWIYFRIGDYQKAREILEELARNGANFPAVHFHLGQTYFALGEYALATTALKQALGFKSSFPDRGEAESLYRKALARSQG